MLGFLQRISDLLTGSSAEQREHEDMTDFYQRKLRENPSTATGLPPPIHIQVEERQVTIGRFRDEPTEEDDQPVDEPVLAPPPVGITSVVPNVSSSAGGTAITITGSNFVTGSTVTIAGVAATSVVFVNSTTITCVTPADGLGYATLDVTSPSGQTASLTNAILYVDRPDNILIEGPREMHSLAPSDPSFPPTLLYPYKATLRLGSQTFVFPPGAAFNLLFVLSGSPSYNANVYDPNGGFFTPVKTAAQFDFSIQETNIGTYLFEFYVSFDKPGENNFVRLPTYGDAQHQPSVFQVLISPNGPYPAGNAGARFVWDRGPGNTKQNPFGWLSNDNNALTIRRIRSDGTLDTTFNGTATLSWTRSIVNAGDLAVALPASATFTSGVANITVLATYTYNDVSHSQSYGYFYLHAVDGSVTGGSPICACLNHL